MAAALRVVAALTLPWGCGACSAPAPAQPAAADLALGPGGDARLPVDGGGCADEAGERALGGACVRAVSGQLVDQAGAPIAQATVTVCADACFFGQSDATGRFVVKIGQYLRVERYSLLPHVNPRRAAFYLPLPAPDAAGDIDLGAPLPLLAMPSDGPAIADDQAAHTYQSGGVTLSVQAGTTFFLSVEDSGDLPLGARFRPLRIADPRRLPFVAAQPGLAPLSLYGFGPFEIDLRRPARLDLDNAPGLPAGTAVEVLGQRGLIASTGGPPGYRFDVVATAHVSPDGKRIEMDPGAGLATLTWIALRQKEK